MEHKIESKLMKQLSLVENKFQHDIIAIQFNKTAIDFKDMVVKGLAHERGNRLLSLSDKNAIKHISFNVR